MFKLMTLAPFRSGTARLRDAAARRIVTLALAMVPVTIATIASAEPECRIVAESRGTVILVTGRVTPEDAMSGEYRLHVTTESGTGRSSVSQNGDFTGPGGEEHPLGAVNVIMRPGTEIDAELTVTTGGQTICSVVYRTNAI